MVNSIQEVKTTKAQKIAGQLLIINGLFVLLGIVLGIEDNSNLTRMLMASIVDIFIGVSIFLGKDKWIVWAKIRVIGGLILFSIIALTTADYWTLSFQIILSLSIILVLFGNAGKIRKIISIALFCIVTLFYVEGTLAFSTGNTITNGLLLKNQYDLVKIEENEKYDISVLSPIWRKRSTQSIANENLFLDLWLVDPFKDSHIMIIYEELDKNLKFEHSAIVQSVLANAGGLGEMEILSESQDLYLGYDRTILIARSIYDNTPFKYQYSIMTNDSEVIQITCFALEEQFKFSEGDFGELINNLSLSDL